MRFHSIFFASHACFVTVAKPKRCSLLSRSDDFATAQLKHDPHELHCTCPNLLTRKSLWISCCEQGLVVFKVKRGACKVGFQCNMWVESSRRWNKVASNKVCIHGLQTGFVASKGGKHSLLQTRVVSKVIRARYK